ncbi:hypothetical protein LMOSA_13801 [Listeria monocytogenes str. Scott A]|nr:hypothetical protein LMOSA_13801 [Listeria monocytogenes str. Scott A]CAS04264.1 Hypothetical protein of unknown function [Listeria monocytogenes serotype 4b str. CLIP 80459]
MIGMFHYLLPLNQIPHNFHAQPGRISQMMHQWDFFHYFNRVSHCTGQGYLFSRFCSPFCSASSRLIWEIDSPIALATRSILSRKICATTEVSSGIITLPNCFSFYQSHLRSFQ